MHKAGKDMEVGSMKVGASKSASQAVSTDKIAKKQVENDRGA
jgi:hypothetical protein